MSIINDVKEFYADLFPKIRNRLLKDKKLYLCELKINLDSFKNKDIAELYENIKNNADVTAPNSLQTNSVESGGCKILTVGCSNKCNLEIPNQIEIFSGLDITDKDDIYVLNINSSCVRNISGDLLADNLVDTNSVLLVNCDSENLDNIIVGFFTLKAVNIDGNQKYLLTANSDNISLDHTKYSNHCFLFPTVASGKIFYFKLSANINYIQTETTGTHLCIDFGTSNTTAGVCLDHVKHIPYLAGNNKNIIHDSLNLVSFKTFTTSPEVPYFSNISPTVVYVKKVGSPNDPDSVDFAFGYEAMNLIKADGYCPMASCFMELKRWITNINKDEDVHDRTGVKIQIRRADVLKKYFLFIIREAENQFKCKFKYIHMTTPVKLRTQTMILYDNILKSVGYQLEKDHALDEGIAVLYGIMDQDIKNNNFGTKKVLVIDCGGGTSDLASCLYTINKDDDGVINWTVKTEYVNGDINFGGNNITYRIMQFMKIVYSELFCSNSKTRINIDDIIPNDTDSIFSDMEDDTDGKSFSKNYESIYESLNILYQKAENVIPTMFINYERSTSDEYNKIKNNFYFLWKQAEEMKKEFYKTNSISRYTFTENKNKNDVDLSGYKDPFWKLYHRNSYDLTTVLLEDEHRPDVTFTAKEIDKLIRADIYNLVRKFLNNLYLNTDDKTNLNSYNIIKLSGQTSKINIFIDCLKEFLPGRKIGRGALQDVEELKLMCIKGSILYVHSLENSSIEGKLENENIVIPISLYAQNSDRSEEMLIKQGSDWEQDVKKIRITKAAKRIPFIMKSSDMVIGKPYICNCENIKWQQISDGDLVKLSGGHISQTECLDKIKDNQYLFVYLDKAKWGFNMLPIKRENNKLFCGDVDFCSFEIDTLMDSFFDGRH